MVDVSSSLLNIRYQHPTHSWAICNGRPYALINDEEVVSQEDGVDISTQWGVVKVIRVGTQEIVGVEAGGRADD
jgi:hypothetical protein